MAVTTYTESGAPGISSRIGGWFSAAYAGIIAAREAEARRYVATSLRMADDKTLTQLGLTREEVNSRPSAPFIF